MRDESVISEKDNNKICAAKPWHQSLRGCYSWTPKRGRKCTEPRPNGVNTLFKTRRWSTWNWEAGSGIWTPQAPTDSHNFSVRQTPWGSSGSSPRNVQSVRSWKPLISCLSLKPRRQKRPKHWPRLRLDMRRVLICRYEVKNAYNIYICI